MITDACSIYLANIQSKGLIKPVLCVVVGVFDIVSHRFERVFGFIRGRFERILD